MSNIDNLRRKERPHEVFKVFLDKSLIFSNQSIHFFPLNTGSFQILFHIGKNFIGFLIEFFCSFKNFGKLLFRRHETLVVEFIRINGSQIPKAADTHTVEFIEIAGINGHKLQSFIQRHICIGGFF